jgi:predicted NBD/HSP70 family sugar kinase
LEAYFPSNYTTLRSDSMQSTEIIAFDLGATETAVAGCEPSGTQLHDAAVIGGRSDPEGELREAFPHADTSVGGDVLAAATAELGFLPVDSTKAVDPQRIVVGGGKTAPWNLLHPALRTALVRAVPHPPEVVRSAFPGRAPLIGAIALGSRTAASRRCAHVLICH